MLLKTPAIISAVVKERKIVSDLIEKESISGIISDNRFGVYSNKIPSVYITHQLNVLSGNTTRITSKIHQYLIKKFDVCWVPDVATKYNLSGELSNIKPNKIKTKYIGILSRFKYKEIPKKHTILVLLSGVEPQRTLFENKLIKELSNFKGNVLLVRGILNESKIKTPSNFTVVNYLLANELEKAILQSTLVIARSGYSTIMDLAVLNANVLFVPTPKQFEQEYLAKHLFLEYKIPFFTQDDFKFEDIKNFEAKGKFKKYTESFPLDLFYLFQSK
ncbi:MAG: glycosyltransferase [Lutibacter sp.]|uniref:glycosyltransferase n=1 Tax=Lutibacter sp. TaxID=1925666 RepID=UPI00299F143E|nr:glycosyltransferase [Lutibacter sp.]MDX1830124.1 glycosyltransferase [Lutibacter sp.]